jgi:polyhydroxyalkanoate synthase
MFFPGLDYIRRVQGHWLEALGYGDEPTPSWVVAEEPGMRLLAYQAGNTVGPPVILIPAPIKRAYIFDLVGRASVVHRCREAGRAVFLLEWADPSAASSHYALADYADRLLCFARDAAAMASGEDHVVLIGHSLGGTLAALQAARRADGIAALILLEAPLVFDPAVDAFAPWLRTPPAARQLLANAGTVAGSELSMAAVAAAPDAFLWHRWGDAFASISDSERRDLHLRVLRWALDEIALPAPLLRDVLQLLYRENRLRHGTLELSGVTIGLADIVAPILAVVERDSRVAPPQEVLPALAATSSAQRQVMTYESDAGVALAHVGVLVGAEAHHRLWPEVMGWIEETVGR